MKDKVIETAGRTWKLLGEKGETDVTQLPKLLGEKDDVVYQSLGWLAREDKINYATKSSKSFVSLVEGELAAFKGTIASIQSEQSVEAQAPQAQRRSGKRSARRI